jgi:hypothetical protein
VIRQLFSGICSDHGKNWQNKAKEIGKEAGLQIGVYHDLEFNPKEYFNILQMKKERLAEQMRDYRQTNDKFVVKEFLDYLKVGCKKSQKTKDSKKRNEKYEDLVDGDSEE